MHCENEQAALPNDRVGFESIAKIAGKLPNALVVCEPTGGYERLLIQAMQARGVPCALANATQTRAFAMSQGVKAKNDPIDARMIHRFAQQRNLQPRAVPDATRQLVAELLDRLVELVGLQIKLTEVFIGAPVIGLRLQCPFVESQSIFVSV